MSASDLVNRGNTLFEKKKPFDSLCQEIAENFFPERADFTHQKFIGTDFASNLHTSYPVIARRDLANIFASMLRPADKYWFYGRVRGYDDLDIQAKQWLESRTHIQYNAMYDPVANFVRATKEGDNDYSAFGQCVLSVDFNRKKQALLYRNWHMRDCAWCEGIDGKINEVHRKWKPTAIQILKYFKNVHPKIKEIADKNPYQEIECRHIVIEADYYNSEKKHRTPFISFYIDVENNHIMEEVGQHVLGYVIPRWQTVSGSQYAYSPATIAALGDARLIQAMTVTLLEAGEKAVNPPMIAAQEAIRGNIEIFAGGVTYVDSEYDERLGEVLRPLTQGAGAIPLGIEMQRDIREQIASAFYLNKIGLPPISKEMTAFEVGQRVSEYVRNALPLFEPMEMEYNGALCEMSFDILMRNGAFGSPVDIPESLRGRDINFVFESPLAEAKEHQKGQRFLETKAMLAEAAALDQGVLGMVDVKSALRDVLSSVSPAKWVRSEEEIAEMEATQQEQAQVQQMMAQLQQGGMAAEQIGNGAKALQEGLGGVV